jgi:hypothetical protein
MVQPQTVIAPPGTTQIGPAVIAVPPIPPPTGPATVEELLAGIQVTVVKADETRQWVYQMAAVLVIGGLAVAFGPGLWAQGAVKLGLEKEASKAPEVVNTPKPVRTPEHSGPTTTVASSASGSRGTWKPFQNRPEPARPVRSSVSSAPTTVAAPPATVSASREVATASVWGTPVAQAPRFTSFAPTPKAMASAIPPPVRSVARESVATVATPSSPPVVGVYRPGDERNDKTFVASLPKLTALSDNSPEWMHLPTDRWPQIMLLNDATFRGHSPAEGTNCVLVEGPGGELWLATSALSIAEEGGVSPPIKPEDVRRTLVRWSGLLPEDGSKIVEIRNGSDLVVGGKANCLLMNVSSRKELGAVKSLRLKSSPPGSGDPLYLVVLPGLDPRTQLVYECTVTAAAETGEMGVSMATPVDASSFHGAALIDSNGDLAGIVVAGNGLGQCVVTPCMVLATLMK